MIDENYLQKQTTAEEYLQCWHILRDNVDIAIHYFSIRHEFLDFLEKCTHEHQIAIDNDTALWHPTIHALETALFIVLGRIFDENSDTLSIHKLLNDTVDHPEFFSDAALAKRKESSFKNKPEKLKAYIQKARLCEPNSKYLRDIKKTLVPYIKKVKEIYQPIRHQLVAHLNHKIVTDHLSRSELLNKVDDSEIEAILLFLHTLLDGLWELYHNGRMPELNKIQEDDKERFVQKRKDATDATRNVLEKLYISF